MPSKDLDSIDIFNDLIELIKPYCKASVLKNLNQDTKFTEDLGINSARLLDLIIDLEDHFQIAIYDDFANVVQTVGDALIVIERKIK